LSRRVGERRKPRLKGPLEYARRAHNYTGERLTRKVTVAPPDSRGHHNRSSAEFVCAAHHDEDGRHAALNVLHILSSKVLEFVRRGHRAWSSSRSRRLARVICLFVVV
jgi:hypothetical protein